MRRHLFCLAAAVLMLGLLSIVQISAVTTVEQKPYGGTFRNPLPSDPPETNIFLRASTWSFVFLDPIYDPLVMLDKDNLPVPWYAESYTVDTTGKVWTLKIVKNGKWHDGKPLTAHDVKFTYEHVMKAKYPRMSEIYTLIERVELVDDYTLKVYLFDVYPPFITEVLTYPFAPKHIWEPIVAKSDFLPFKYVPTMEVLKVGNGPFILEEYVTASHVKYKAFKEFFKGRPYVDELLMPIITSPDAGLLAVKAGQVDVWSWSVPAEAVPSIVTDRNLAIHIYKSGTMYHWGFNNAKFPFDNKKFRQAMAYCVNKKEIVDVLLHGYGRPGRYGVYPSTEMWNEWLNKKPECGVDAYPFDLEKAKKILDDLGLVDKNKDGWRDGPDGKTIEFEIGPPTYDPVRVRSAELISANLAKVGIKGNVVYQEWSTLWNRIIAPLDSLFKVQTFLLGSGMGVGDPDVLHFRLHSSKISNPNYYGFINAEFDKLADEQRKTVDPAKRADMIRRMQEILAEEVPLIVLYHRDFITVYRTDKFDGWVLPIQDGPDNQWTWMNIYEKKPPPPPPKPPPTFWEQYGLILVIAVGILGIIGTGAAYSLRKK